MFKNLSKVAALCLMLTASPAAAQEAYDWTGFYFGLHGGAATGDADTDANLSGELDFCVFIFFCEDDVPYDLDGEASNHLMGVLGGAQVGFDYAAGNFVFGVVGDVSVPDLDGRADIAFLPDFGGFDDFVASASVSTSVDWMATARVRAGLGATGMGLLYVTGGLAVADVDTSVSYTVLGEDGSFSGNDTRYGWTVGFGGEAPITNRVTIGLEYLYTDLGSWDVGGDSGSAGSMVGCGIVCAETDFDIGAENEMQFHTWRAAINVKLGGSGN